MFPFSFYIPLALAHDAYFQQIRTACKRPLLSACSARYLICGLSRHPYVLLSLQLCFNTDIFSDPPLEYSFPRSNLFFPSRFQLDFGPTVSAVVHLKGGCYVLTLTLSFRLFTRIRSRGDRYPPQHTRRYRKPNGICCWTAR